MKSIVERPIRAQLKPRDLQTFLMFMSLSAENKARVDGFMLGLQTAGGKPDKKK